MILGVWALHPLSSWAVPFVGLCRLAAFFPRCRGSARWHRTKTEPGGDHRPPSVEPPRQPVHDSGQGSAALPAPSRCRLVCATPTGANRSARLAGVGIQFLPRAAEHEWEVFHCPKLTVCALQTARSPGEGYLFKVKSVALPRPSRAGTTWATEQPWLDLASHCPASPIPAWHHHDGDPGGRLRLHLGSWSLGGHFAPHGLGLGGCATPGTHRELLTPVRGSGQLSPFESPPAQG